MSKNDMESYCYAVIGGGIAGVTCAEHLYILDPDEKTVLITPSPLVKAVTNVFPVTKTCDMFDVEERAGTELESECPNVTVENGYVTRLDPIEQILHLSNGKKIRYNKVCVCTGGKPKIIANDEPLVLSIRDTESVQQFQKKIDSARRIVIVGNGGIATEMIYEITGIEIVWVIKDKHMNATFIDPGAAEFFKPELDKEKLPSENISKRKKYTIDDVKLRICKSADGNDVFLGGALGPDWHSGLELKGDLHHQIKLETETEVKSILSPEQLKNSNLEASDEGSWPIYVELKNGKIYGCDFIVSATGVVPNSSFIIKGNEFEVFEDGGLLVNESMETSYKNVYAAGDVCVPRWDSAKHWFQMKLWTQARQMGSYAAKSMWSSKTGEEIYMDFCFEIFTHATKFFGHKVVLLGLFNGQKLGDKYEILLRMTKGSEYIKCVMVDGKMQGALLIGETDLEETFENLILNQLDLSIYGEDLLDPNIDIEDYFD